VAVDVAHVGRFDAGVLEGGTHGARRALAVGMGSRRMVAVRGEPVPGNDGTNPQTQSIREVVADQHEHRTTFAEGQPATVARIRGGGFR
jgi:hypothetical protein